MLAFQDGGIRAEGCYQSGGFCGDLVLGRANESGASSLLMHGAALTLPVQLNLPRLPGTGINPAGPRAAICTAICRPLRLPSLLLQCCACHYWGQSCWLFQNPQRARLGPCSENDFRPFKHSALLTRMHPRALVLKFPKRIHLSSRGCVSRAEAHHPHALPQAAGARGGGPEPGGLLARHRPGAGGAPAAGQAPVQAPGGHGAAARCPALAQRRHVPHLQAPLGEPTRGCSP